MIRMYHGTAREYLPSILKKGLRNPYLTDNIEVALQYAEGAGGDIVLMVEVSQRKFKVDKPSLREPVAYATFKGYELDAAIDDLYRKFGKRTEKDWRLSFPITRTVRYKGVVPPSKIWVVQS